MITEAISITSLQSFFTKIAILLIAYFTPVAEMINVMLIFLTVDTISGIWASVKTGHKIESNKLRKTVYKFIWYTISVMLAWMMEHTFKIEWSNLASLTAGFICFVELKSVFENVSKITGDPIFLRIIKIFKKKWADTINEQSNDDEKKESDGTKS